MVLVVKMEKNLVTSHIPTKLTEAQFALIVLPHLTVGRRGPNKKLPFFALFNYILGTVQIRVPIKCRHSPLPITQHLQLIAVFRLA